MKKERYREREEREMPLSRYLSIWGPGRYVAKFQAVRWREREALLLQLYYTPLPPPLPHTQSTGGGGG